MTTIFQTGPGFFSAVTNDKDRSVPVGKMRIYCARIEAYDLDQEERMDMDTNVTILFSMAEKDPKVALVPLRLGDAIGRNRKNLEAFAKK